ncbi:MAG: DUF2892 domain-containing protein [Candidatus Gracilibacteria bacterium]|nr:DUF2892 domain-containing protein [Candidatus Gracilibacteria bacterium]
MHKFFAPNEGTADRIIRAVLGIAAAVGAYLISGWLQVVLAVVAVMLVFTAITGFCGLYTLLGIRTCPLPKKK